MRLRSKLSILLFVVLSKPITAPSSSNTSILISAGVNRGGFGDIVPNIMAAQYLSTFVTDTDVTLWVTEQNREAVLLLLGVERLPNTFQGFKLLYTSQYDGENLPPADISMCVAGCDLSLPPLTAKLQIQINAFGTRTDQGVDQRVVNLTPTPVYRYNAGPAFQSIYYFHGLAVQSNLDAVLAGAERRSILSRIFTRKNKYFTYVHANTGEFVEVFLKGLSATVPRNERITVLMGRTEIFKFNRKPFLVPNNVDLLTIAHTPAHAYAAIERANLPVLVTGNSSVSFALQAHKPFFVEVLGWDEGFFQDVIASLPYEEWDNLKLSSREDLNKYFENVRTFTIDLDRQKKFIAAISAINEDWSLSKRLRRVVTMYRNGFFRSKSSNETADLLGQVFSKNAPACMNVQN